MPYISQGNAATRKIFINNFTTIYWHVRTWNTRGVQKVRRQTQLVTRYLHHILSLFNIDSWNRNALGLAFLQSSDSVVKELLILLFQPAIWHAIYVVHEFLPFYVSIMWVHKWVRKFIHSAYKCRVGIWQKFSILFSRLKEFTRGRKFAAADDVICTANC